MNYYNKKCLGCGQYFSKEKNSPSYVENANENTKYCKRCFQLKHYGVLENANVYDEQIKHTLENIDFSLGSTVMVLDLFDIENSLIESFKDKKNLLLVVNKISFFKQLKKMDLITDKIKNFLVTNGWNQKVVFYDAINKFKINEIDAWIKNESKQKRKVYIVGNTNAGKSSLINALLEFNKKEPVLSVSSIKNTTINLSKIVLDKFTSVIDTPGFTNEKNFLSIINTNKKINFKKMSYRSYPLKDNNQIFFLEAVASIYCKQLQKDKSSSIQFFLPDNFYIHRTNIKNYEKVINKKNELFEIHLNNEYELSKTVLSNLESDVKYTLFLNGVGMMTIKNVQEIEIQFPKHFKVNLIKDNLI